MRNIDSSHRILYHKAQQLENGFFAAESRNRTKISKLSLV